MARVVVGVAGGIAAYKVCELVRRFKEAGHDCVVVPTVNALEFVGKTTWAALSGNPVYTDVFEAPNLVPHVSIGQQADLVVVAPATANVLAKAAAGMADDLLSTALLTAHCPVVFAPAMHTEMWQHAATRHNVEVLRSRGCIVIEPAVGRLTGKDSGPGRMPEPSDIAATCLTLLDQPEFAAQIQSQVWRGLKVIVTAGGTKEPLDPVRFIGNSSSGRMGVELARAAKVRGAEVTLICANVDLPIPAAVDVIQVQTAAQLQQAVQNAQICADVVIMAAAVSDYRPNTVAEQKIKKETNANLHLDLVPNPDILQQLCAQKTQSASWRQVDGKSQHVHVGPKVIVGFAAETADSVAQLEQLGRAKLNRKGCDLLVCNDVSRGQVFGQEHNSVIILDSNSTVGQVQGSKSVVAHGICQAISAKLDVTQAG